MKKNLIGITGSVASGKSSVLNYLNESGYKTFSADDVVKEIYNKDDIQKKTLKILPEIGVFDKAQIASIIYSSKKKRTDLENLIHPIVKKRLAFFENSLNHEEIGFAEVPLLFEKNLKNKFKCVIVVSCNDTTRKKRAISRGMTAKIFDMICKIQMTDEEKQKKADFVIKTDIDESLWKKNIDKIVEQLKS